MAPLEPGQPEARDHTGYSIYAVDTGKIHRLTSVADSKRAGDRASIAAIKPAVAGG